MKVIIGVVVLVFAILIGLQELEKQRVLFYTSLNSDYLNIDNSKTEEDDENQSLIIVTLSGQVKSPGKYRVEMDTFLEEVIELAGGLLTNADYDAFNPYLLIEEESSFYIAPQNDNEKVSLNEGSIEDFQTIPSIGITLATRIYEYKQLNGEYKQLEDIMNVSGIKGTIFNKIKDYIILWKAA